MISVICMIAEKVVTASKVASRPASICRYACYLAC